MKEYLTRLFRGLNGLIPPPAGMKHSIAMCQYGSSRHGWEDRPSIVIAATNGQYQTLFIEAHDFEKSPEVLALDCFKAIYGVPQAENAA